MLRSLNIKCTRHDGSEDEPSIVLLEEGEGYNFEINNANPQIILIPEGMVEIADQEQVIPEIKGSCFMIPPGHRTRITLCEDSTLLIFNLRLDSQFCMNPTLAELSRNYIPEEHPFFILKSNEALHIFEESIIPFLKADLCCECYLHAETLKLLHVLFGFYHRQEMAMFFSPLISEDIQFRGQVLSKIDKATTVTQLHELTTPEIHPARFRAKFQSTFGTNPHEYITNHKKKVVHSQVTATDESFKVIAFENGFSSQQVFIEFCKRHFELTPTKLRQAYRSELQK